MGVNQGSLKPLPRTGCVRRAQEEWLQSLDNARMRRRSNEVSRETACLPRKQAVSPLFSASIRDTLRHATKQHGVCRCAFTHKTVILALCSRGT